MNIDIETCLTELKTLISDNVTDYKFTIPELKRHIDEINLKGTNELKLKLAENNSYLIMIDFQLVFNEKKIIKKLKSSDYELTSDQSIVLELIGKFFLSSLRMTFFPTTPPDKSMHIPGIHINGGFMKVESRNKQSPIR
jgi:hypothetical protein